MMKMNLIAWIWFGLIQFYGISTAEGYFMPNSFLYIWTVLFQIIQFNISTQFKSQKQFYFELFSFVKKVKWSQVLYL